MIRVGVLGAQGRMGSEVCRAVEGADGMQVAAAVDVGDARDPLADCDVVVDFTHPDAVLDNLKWCLARGRNVVVGTSGFDGARLAAVGDWLEASPSARALIVPNFSVGAVLMMRFAEQAARFFESAEVIELHHAAKLDAPSGTALSTARRLAARRKDKPFTHRKAEKETLAGTRGGEEGGVAVHSVRLPGFVADQEVIFGLPGQTLTIAHRTTSREAYVPGVVLAIRRVTSEPRFYRGLDQLLGLRID
jgi:4-hydroxy-tetrahydrodipicolinate reductase